MAKDNMQSRNKQCSNIKENIELFYLQTLVDFYVFSKLLDARYSTSYVSSAISCSILLNFCVFLLSGPFVLNPDTLTTINYAIFNQTFRLLWSFPTTLQLRSKLRAYFHDSVVGICYILLERHSK